MRKIAGIIVANDLNGTPATTHRPSGIVWVNLKLIGQLPPKQMMSLDEFIAWVKGKGDLTPEKWYFIIKHEEGHIVMNTTNEVACDEYASQEFFKRYNKPSATAPAMADVMPNSNTSQSLRIIKQYQRAAAHDCSTNGHAPACRLNQEATMYLRKHHLSNFSGQQQFDLGDCMSDCKKAFPHGPINQKKCIDACKAKGEQVAEQNKQAAEIALKQEAIRAQLEQAKLQANSLTAPELAALGYEYDIAKTNADKPQVFTAKNIVPLALGLAAVVLIVYLIAQD